MTGCQILSRCTKQKHIGRKDLFIMVLFKLGFAAGKFEHTLSILLKALIQSEKLLVSVLVKYLGLTIFSF